MSRSIRESKKVHGKEYYGRGHCCDDCQHGDGLFKKKLTRRPSAVNKLLKKYGDEKVMKVEACRLPIDSMTKRLLNVVSLGAFNKAIKELNYDEVFHLYLKITIPSGTFYIEKNQRLNLGKMGKPYHKKSNKIECRAIKLSGKKSLKDMFSHLEAALGEWAYRYNAVKYNCQNFVSTLLDSLGEPRKTQKIKSFVNANSGENLIKSPLLRKIAQTVTDAASLGQQAVLGNGVMAVGGFISGEEFEVGQAEKCALIGEADPYNPRCHPVKPGECYQKMMTRGRRRRIIKRKCTRSELAEWNKKKEAA
jgi:hypothetical protein